MSLESLLSVNDLQVNIGRKAGVVHALRGVNLSLRAGVFTGLVGESGSGKTMTALSIIRLLPEQAIIKSGKIHFDGRELLQLGETEMMRIRGEQVSMVFQNAPASLNPLFPVGSQIADVYRYHEQASPKEAWEKAVEMLDAMGIPDAPRKAKSYPHEYSGGMCQRAMIAMALVCSPRLLIADEPTTGLDVTIQAQVLDVIVEVIERLGASLLFISHDMGVVAEICDDMIVMYAGQVVESGTVEQVMSRPGCPYTSGLVECFKMEGRERMGFIPGRVPDLRTVESGCSFAQRCPLYQELPEIKQARCLEEAPVLKEVEDGHLAACHYAGIA